MCIHYRSGFTALLAAAGLALAAPAVAQVCAAPMHLTPNVVTFFDTCQGERFLPLACTNLFPLAGPALVVRLDLPYPAGTITVQQASVFDPSVFLLRAQCTGDAPCSAMVDAYPPGLPRILDLSGIDSGGYFMLVAGMAGSPENASCGLVHVLWSVSADDLVRMNEGIFRSGNAPVVDPPQP